MSSIRNALGFWNGLAPPGRRLIIGALVIFAIGLVLLWRISGQTSYATLASDMSAEEAKAVTDGLDAAGIPYELEDGGTAVAVPEDQADEARIELAGQNLLDGATGVGYEIFDRNDLGATDFTQRVNLIRATEGELSRVIAQLDPVQSATVKVAMPEDRLFTDEQQPTTASVLIAMRAGSTLDPAQVKGITQLVATAVPGLEPAKITVSDQNGNLLEGAGGDVASAATGAQTRLALEGEYERSTQARLDAMLAQIFGPNKAVTQVDAVLDLDRIETERETFGQDATPLEQEESTEELDSEGGGAGAPAGAAANVPGATFPATAGGGGETTYNKDTNKVRNGVDHERQSIATTPGTVTSQSISVQVSDEIPPEQVAAIENAVTAAVGFEEGRDQINVQSVPFAEDGIAGAEEVEAAPAGLPFTLWDALKAAALALGVLLLVLVARKALRRRQSALERALPELLERGPVPLAELAPEPERELARIEGKSKTDVERQMEDLAARQPADVAQLLRGWLLEKG
jgi:flagellar M-ring protein FliF